MKFLYASHIDGQMKVLLHLDITYIVYLQSLFHSWGLVVHVDVDRFLGCRGLVDNWGFSWMFLKLFSFLQRSIGFTCQWRLHLWSWRECDNQGSGQDVSLIIFIFLLVSTVEDWLYMAIASLIVEGVLIIEVLVRMFLILISLLISFLQWRIGCTCQWRLHLWLWRAGW